jgi:aspartate aminotransferase-like enzyme
VTPFGTFFLPGPTEVRTEVLTAMTRPMIPHRGKAFEAVYASVNRGLQHAFRTVRPVYMSTSSASGLMEAAVRCAPAGPILSLVNGAFSERFANIARACDRETLVLETAAGTVHDFSAVDAALSARWYAAMTVVHSETSTGALSDIAALATIAHKYGTMILVDSVTGIGGAPVETDAWGLDFVLTGSQKALALPPGLAFGVASEAFVLQAQTAHARGLYFDLVEFEQFAHKNQTPNTPAVSLLYAADVQMQAIVAEGIEARWARHATMRAMTEAWCETQRAAGLPIGILATEGSRSPTVSAIRLPEGIAPGAVVKAIAERGFVVGGGYGAMKNVTFRVGHMGDHTPDRLALCLAACADALRTLTKS